MKIAGRIIVVLICFFVSITVFSSCDDDEDEADALGRVANESIYDLEDITYGDVEIGECDADKETEYVGIPLQSERLKFKVRGYSGTVETDRFDAPEKDKKYTIEITSYTSSYYNTITFYYQWYDDGNMRSVSEKKILVETGLAE